MIQPSYIQSEIDISRLSAFKTPATTKYFFELYEETLTLLPEVYDFIEQEKLPIIIIAGGTNCLFAFERWEGIVIKIANKGYSREGNILTLSGAEMSSAISSELYKKYNISTLVPWVGLPGTIAGAVIGNAGCFGLETSDICQEVVVFDQETRDFRTLSRKEIGFSYRESHLK